MPSCSLPHPRVQSWALIWAGRGVFGVGTESLCVAQRILIARWFVGREIALAMGIILAFGRFGSVVNDNVSALYGPEQVLTAYWVGAGFCLLSVLASTAVAAVDAAQDVTHSPAALLRLPICPLFSGILVGSAVHSGGSKLAPTELELPLCTAATMQPHVPPRAEDEPAESRSAAAYYPSASAGRSGGWRVCTEDDDDWGCPNLSARPQEQRSPARRMPRQACAGALSAATASAVFNCTVAGEAVPVLQQLHPTRCDKPEACKGHVVAPSAVLPLATERPPHPTERGQTAHLDSDDVDAAFAAGPSCEQAEAVAALLPAGAAASPSSSCDVVSDRCGASPPCAVAHVQHFSRGYWVLLPIVLCGFPCITSFNGVASALLAARWGDAGEGSGNSSDTRARVNATMGILYSVAAALALVSGGVIDRVGRRAPFLLASLLGVCAVHATFALSGTAPAELLLALLGVCFAFLAAAFWPSISFLVPPSSLGAAYGLMGCVQNAGLSAVPLAVSELQPPHCGDEFTCVELLFAGLAGVGAVAAAYAVYLEQPPRVPTDETVNCREARVS